MAEYKYSDAEMNAVIGCISEVEKTLVLVRDAASQAVSTLRTVQSAGGDLGAAIDGTVLGNAQNALSLSDQSLGSLTRMRKRFEEGQQILRQAGVNVVVETGSQVTTGPFGGNPDGQGTVSVSSIIE